MLSAGSISSSSPTGVILVVLCPTISISLSLSSIPTMLKILKEKSVGPLPALPYLSLILAQLSYGLYGFIIQDIVCLLSLTGAVLGVMYSIIYAMYLPKEKFLSFSLKVLATAIIAAFQGYLFIQNNQKLLSLTTQILCALLYFSPLITAIEVCKSKNTESMPLCVSLMSFSSSMLWSFYGYFSLNDITVWGVCSLGALFGMMQLILIYLYRGSCSSDDQLKKQDIQRPYSQMFTV